jgi:hypothetical protein
VGAEVGGGVELNWERWAPTAGTGTGMGKVVTAPPRVGRREIMSTYGWGGPGMGVGIGGVGTGASLSPSPSPPYLINGTGTGVGMVPMPVLRAPGSVFDPAGVLSSSASASAGMLVPQTSGYSGHGANANGNGLRGDQRRVR